MRDNSLLCAAIFGDLERIRELLTDFVHVDATFGSTALLRAIWHATLAVARLLLGQAADVGVLDMYGNTPRVGARSVDLAKGLVEYGFDSATSGVQSTWMSPTLFVRNKDSKTTTINQRNPVLAKYLDSFEFLPLVDQATMSMSPDLNEFQRFLARRVYYTVLPKLGRDIALLVMAFLSPADVMK